MNKEKKLRKIVTSNLTYIYPGSTMELSENYAANSSVILALMEKTRNLLSIYRITADVFSKEVIDECIAELSEHITINSTARHTYNYSAYSLYGEGEINYSGNKPSGIESWKKICSSASESAALLMWYILKHRMDIEWYDRYDCYTAEHILAAYNGLWFHITYFPAMSDKAFHLLVKNVCTIVHMNCIEFMNNFPQHIEEIKKNIY